MGLLRGFSPPLVCVTWLFPAPPCFPAPEFSPSAWRGAAAAAQPRPADPKCEEGPPQLSGVPGRRVCAGNVRRAGSGGGRRGASRDRLSWPCAAGVCPPLPRPPLRGDSQVCAPLSGFCLRHPFRCDSRIFNFSKGACDRGVGWWCA